jgi:heme a synthase
MSSVAARLSSWNSAAVQRDSAQPVDGRIVTWVRSIATWAPRKAFLVVAGLLGLTVLSGGAQSALKDQGAIKYLPSTINTLAIMGVAIVVLGRWVRVSPNTLRRVALVSAVLLGFIILTGAAVRLTGSGLGCVDWPTCNNGSVTPELNDAHGLIEFGNRIVTGLCVLAAGIGVLATLVRVPYRRDLVRPAIVVVVAIMGNAVLGGLMVKQALPPTWVLSHFLLAIAALAAGVMVFHRSGEDRPTHSLLGNSRVNAFGSTETMLGRALLGSATLTLFLGTLVTGSGPHAGDEISARLGFAMSTVARWHSLAAWLSLVCVVALARQAFRRRDADELQRRIKVLLAVVFVQGAIGYTQWFNQVPAKLVMLHIVGAVSYWASVLWVRAVLTHPPVVEATVRARSEGSPAGSASPATV